MDVETIQNERQLAILRRRLDRIHRDISVVRDAVIILSISPEKKDHLAELLGNLFGSSGEVYEAWLMVKSIESQPDVV